MFSTGEIAFELGEEKLGKIKNKNTAKQKFYIPCFKTCSYNFINREWNRCKNYSRKIGTC